jgi:hypothetical protein
VLTASRATESSFEGARTVAEIASMLVPLDPARAGTLFEQAVQRVNDSFKRAPKPQALSEIAVAWVGLDLDRALRVADTIGNDYWKAYALSSMVRAAARKQ